MHTEYRLSVAALCGENAAQTENFVRSLMNETSGVELLLCGEEDASVSALAGGGNAIRFIRCENGAAEALNRAAQEARGEKTIFSAVSVTFAPGAVDELCACKGACACNAAVVENGEPNQLLRENFSPHELFAPAVVFNHALKTEVIRENGLALREYSPLALAVFSLEYRRFDRVEPIHRVLMYSSADQSLLPDAGSEAALAEVCEKGGDAEFALSALNLLFSYYTSLDSAGRERFFPLLRRAALPLSGEPAVRAWLAAAYFADVEELKKEQLTAGDFEFLAGNIFYREKTLPILADDVVRDFYGGKLSFNTLRRCVAAWLYFKLYRMGGPAKKLGCAVCRRLVGGDFNA